MPEAPPPRVGRETAARIDPAHARAAEPGYREVAEAMPQPVWMARPDGELSYVNKRVAEYFTKAGEEIVVKGWLDVVHPDDRERVIERWVLALQTGAKYEVEFRLLRASDGEYRWHLGLAEPVRSHGGEILHWSAPTPISMTANWPSRRPMRRAMARAASFPASAMSLGRRSVP
jgi:PAS domain S-box-containing protein